MRMRVATRDLFPLRACARGKLKTLRGKRERAKKKKKNEKRYTRWCTLCSTRPYIRCSGEKGPRVWCSNARPRKRSE